MKINKHWDSYLANCISTVPSAIYEYDQIDTRKGCFHRDNVIHGLLGSLKLVPFVGNATFFLQKICPPCGCCLKNSPKTTAVASTLISRSINNQPPAPPPNNQIEEIQVVNPVTNQNHEERSNSNQDRPTSKKVGINIPVDLLQDDILTFFDQKEILEKRLVSKQWAALGIFPSENEQNRLVKSLIAFLAAEMDQTKYPDQHKALLAIIKDHKIHSSQSLKEIHAKLVVIASLLINTLKTYDVETLKKIKGYCTTQSMPKGCANFIEAIDFYILLIECKQQWVYETYDSLSTYAKTLAKKGLFNQAIDFALLIPEEKFQSSALQSITDVLAENKFFEKAYGVAVLIKSDERRSNAFEKLIYLTTLKDHELAFKLAQEIPETDRSAWALHYDLSKEGAVEAALRYLKIMSDTGNKSAHYKSIVNALIAAKNIEQAIEVANLIPDEMWRGWALKDIVESILANGSSDQIDAAIDQALKLAKTITHVKERSEALMLTVRALARNGNIDEALELTESISYPKWKSWAIEAIVLKLAKDGQTKQASELALTITDAETLEDTLRRLARYT